MAGRAEHGHRGVSISILELRTHLFHGTRCSLPVRRPLAVGRANHQVEVGINRAAASCRQVQPAPVRCNATKDPARGEVVNSN